MKELEKILKALGNRRRLAILKYLKRDKEAFVDEIAKEIDLSYRSTSRHLATLFGVDIVQREQKGHEMFYSLNATQHAVTKFVLGLL